MSAFGFNADVPSCAAHVADIGDWRVQQHELGSVFTLLPLGLFPFVQSTIFNNSLKFTVANRDARDGQARTPAFAFQIRREERRSPSMAVSRKIWLVVMGLFAAPMVTSTP